MEASKPIMAKDKRLFVGFWGGERKDLNIILPLKTRKKITKIHIGTLMIDGSVVKISDENK